MKKLMMLLAMLGAFGLVAPAVAQDKAAEPAKAEAAKTEPAKA